LQEVKKRLLGEQAQGGSAKFQNRVKENLTDVEEKIAASHAEIERLQKERQDLVDKRDQLTGKAAKDNKKQIDEADKALKEKHKEQAKEQARLQKELAEQQKKDDAERFRLQQSISQTVAREFGNASRETRGGFGGQLAEQIAGTTSGDTVQVKMLDLTVKQLAELQKLNATIGTAGILTFGAE
jgi:seryl-tRNA synthetase